MHHGLAFYKQYTTVDDFFANRLRPQVIAQSKPRKVFVQANTFLEGGGDDEMVVLKEYDATPEGMIQSFVDREYI